MLKILALAAMQVSVPSPQTADPRVEVAFNEAVAPCRLGIEKMKAGDEEWLMRYLNKLTDRNKARQQAQVCAVYYAGFAHAYEDVTK